MAKRKIQSEEYDPNAETVVETPTPPPVKKTSRASHEPIPKGMRH